MAIERGMVVRELMQAVSAFQERKLWKRFTNFDCFGVRVPGLADLLLASVMGEGGEQFGLWLLRGPGAVESLRELVGESTGGDDQIEAMDFLSYSMAPFGTLSSQAQDFYRAVGIYPRHDEEVSDLMIKPPYRQVRLPADGELVLLTRVLQAALVADRRKLLEPARVDDRKGICVVTLGPDAENVLASVTRELPPPPPAPVRSVITAPLNLTGVALLAATWLIGTVPVPARIEDDDRSARTLLVAEEVSNRILHTHLYCAENIPDVVAALATWFSQAQPGGKRRIARQMVFSNRSLHDAVAPALEAAGVHFRFVPAIPQLLDIAEELLSTFVDNAEAFADAGAPAPVPAPDDLAGWKRVDRRLAERFRDHLWEGRRMLAARPVTRYFDADDFDEQLQAHEQRGVAMAYAAWCALDYRPTKKQPTFAEKLLAAGLPEAEALLLRARMEAPPTIYRVARCDPPAGAVDVEDVLLGGTVRVYDQLLSENIEPDLYLVGRTFPAGQFHFFEPAGPPLGRAMVTEAIDFLRYCKLEFTREGLRREPHKFGWLWWWISDWEAHWRMPKLVNTDGEDMLLHTASFALADPAAVRQALQQRADLEYLEAEDEYIWFKHTGKGAKMLGGPVTLGRIEFVGDELVLSTNSAQRFATARAWLSKVPGVSFRDVRTETVEPGKQRPLDDKMASEEEVELSPEELAGIQEHFRQQYMDWLDHPLPMFNGKSPRQMCQTEAGREQVRMLIRTIPEPAGNVPIKVPRQAMLKELGLSTAADIFADEPSPPLVRGEKVGHNEPCPCGSGKKYKKCCGR